MPSWKKVILSGSDAALNSLTVSNGITGSLFGTSSWAVNAQTASFVTASNVYGPFGSNSVATASYALTASFSLATSANTIRVINKSGNTISKGMVVHLTGSNNSSDTPYVITASYENDFLSANTLGIASETITTNNTGFITTEGVLTGIDVTGFISGQVLYLGPAGSIIGSAPVAPLHGVRLGQVVRDSPSNNGAIYVRIDNGYEIGELHDVVDTSTTSSYGDLLVKSGSVWTNSRQLTGSYGLTGSLQATSFTGSLFGTASWAVNAQTASFITGSNVYGPFGSNSIISASFAVSSSRAVTASFAQTASNIGPAIANNVDNYILTATGNGTINGESNLTFNGSTLAVTGNVTATSFTGSLFGTASWATNATTATNANNVAVTDTTTGTGPYYLMFGDGTTGNRAVRVDSSTLTFNATTNTLTVPNLAGTASWATNALTASFVTGSNVFGPFGSNSITSASFAVSSSRAVSSSFASTASLVSSIASNITNNTNNYILTATGGSTINGESNLTFDGALLTQVGRFLQGGATSATGQNSHAQGRQTQAVGDESHAEGDSTLASGSYSHAEGRNTVAKGVGSHAEGQYTLALGENSHAEGYFTTASAVYSHAAGLYSVSLGKYQSVIGQYNLSSSADSAFIIGNGTGLDASRSNLVFASGSQFQITGSLNVTGSSIVVGSLTVGSSSLGPSENTVTLGARDSGGEGGQLGFNASGGTYTSASMLDNYQNRFRLLRGTNAGSDAEVAWWSMHNKQMALPAYNSVSAFSGTATALLAVDTSGNVITVATGSGGGGSGTVTQVNTAGTVNGITLTGGPITTTGTITLGGTLSGIANSQLTNSSLMIGNSSISLGATASSLTGLTSVTATSFTGSLQGTSSWANNATNAVNVGVTDNPSSGGGPFYIPFVAASTGNAAIQVDSSTLLYAPSTNTITVTNLAGTASWATNVTTAQTASFVTGSNVFGPFGSNSIRSASFAVSSSYAEAARTVGITLQDTTPVTYNVTFTGGTSGNNTLAVDSTTLTYNPSTSTFTTPIVNSTTAVQGGNGSVSAPAFSFSGDTDTGMYNAGANIIGFAQGGQAMAIMSASGFHMNSSGTKTFEIGAGSAGDTNLVFSPNTTGGTGGNINVNHPSLPLIFKLNSTERARITTAGNVGIGTTTPNSGSLHVNGNVFATSYTGSLFGTASWATNATSATTATSANTLTTTRTIWGQNFNGSANVTGNLTSVGTISGSAGVDLDIIAGASARVTLMNPGADAVRFGTSNTVRWSVDGATGYLSAQGAQTLRTTTGNLTISTGAGNGNILLTPDGTGNVGIGTTSPAQKLEVNGNIKLSSTAGATATPSYIWLGNDYSNGSTRDKLKVYLYNSGTEQYGFSVGSASDIQYHSNAIHDFYLANSAAVRINSTGVGIGTTSPTAKLHVTDANKTFDGYGNVNIFTSDAAAVDKGGSIAFGGVNATGGTSPYVFAKIQGIKEGSTSNYNGALILGTTSNSSAVTEKMRITAAGDVGIGLSSPSQKLDVYGVAVFGTNTNRYTTIGGSSGTMFTQGEVGGWAFGHHAKGSSGTDRGGFGWLGSSDAISYYYIGPAYNTATMYITSGSSASVGIGTSSPSQTLHVVGSARITGAVYDSSNSAGTSGQVLSSTGTGTSWVTSGGGAAFPYTGSALITGSLGITGSLSTTGSDAFINGVRVGRGKGNIITNTAVGTGSLSSNTTGYSNVAVGANTLTAGTTGAANTAIGEGALKSNTGSGNTAIGRYAGFDNTSGTANVIIGTSLNYEPDATTFNGSYTLSIGKNSSDLEGYPHIWAPDTVAVSNTTNTTILTVDPSTYSGFFLEYVFDDTNGTMRSGTIKAIFTSTMSSIQWSEVDVLSISTSLGAVFSVVDDGSSKIAVKLDNNTGGTLFCNFTSRLILRQL